MGLGINRWMTDLFICLFFLAGLRMNDIWIFLAFIAVGKRGLGGNCESTWTWTCHSHLERSGQGVYFSRNVILYYDALCYAMLFELWSLQKLSSRQSLLIILTSTDSCEEKMPWLTYGRFGSLPAYPFHLHTCWLASHGVQSLKRHYSIPWSRQVSVWF